MNYCLNYYFHLYLFTIWHISILFLIFFLLLNKNKNNSNYKENEELELIKKIKELENKYQSELKRNIELNDTNKKLNDKLNIKIEENEKLIKQKELLEKKLRLNEQLLSNNSDSKIKELEDKINNLNIQYKSELNKNKELISKVENLKIQLNNTSKEDIVDLYRRIDELNKKLSRYPFELLKEEKIISVIFTSDDENIHYSVICKNTEKFIRLEEKLKNKYPDYSEFDCSFKVNGKKIDKFKSLDENNIQNGDIIILKTLNKI